MKFASSLIICTATTVNGSTFHGNQIRRQLQGAWIDSIKENSVRQRRAPVDGEQGFQTLATMMMYMNGFGQDMNDPEDNGQYMDEVARLEDTYTNYGCYCWIDGADVGVIGGGKTKDMTDHHCKELYRCYKCVNIDYAKNYTDVEYSVEFGMNADGDRQLDCGVNSKQDAENICECDKRFAEAIAETVDSCEAGQVDDEKHGPYCMDDDLVTVTGGGSFDSRNQCEKAFPDHQKSQCCGIYPNRVPYDDDFAECCRMESQIEDVFKFRKLPVGQCQDFNGEVVVSEAGNPNSYIAVQQLLQNNNNNSNDDDEDDSGPANMFAGRK